MAVVAKLYSTVSDSLPIEETGTRNTFFVKNNPTNSAYINHLLRFKFREDFTSRIDFDREHNRC